MPDVAPKPEVIAMRRKLAGLWLEDVGRACGVGRQSVWRWEQAGRWSRPVPLSRRKRLAKALGCSVAALAVMPNPSRKDLLQRFR